MEKKKYKCEKCGYQSSQKWRTEIGRHKCLIKEEEEDTEYMAPVTKQENDFYLDYEEEYQGEEPLIDERYSATTYQCEFCGHVSEDKHQHVIHINTCDLNPENTIKNAIALTIINIKELDPDEKPDWFDQMQRAANRFRMNGSVAKADQPLLQKLYYAITGKRDTFNNCHWMGIHIAQTVVMYFIKNIENKY